MRESHDPAFERRFDRRRTVEDLLRGFAPPGVAARLDFASLERMPADYVDDDLRASRGGALWRVRHRRGGGGSGIGELAIGYADGADLLARLESSPGPG